MRNPGVQSLARVSRLLQRAGRLAVGKSSQQGDLSRDDKFVGSEDETRLDFSRRRRHKLQIAYRINQKEAVQRKEPK